MQWTAAAQQASGTAVALVQVNVARRFGEDARLIAEDEAIFCIEAMAEDLAWRDARVSGLPALVLAAHITEAATAYRYRPSLAHRISAALNALVTCTARTA